METAIPLLVLLPLAAYVLAKAFAYLSNGNFRDLLGLVGWWLAGAIIAFVSNQATIVAGKEVGGITFGKLGWADIVLAGFMIAGPGNYLNDYRAARDNTDSSARMPMFAKMFGDKGGEHPPPVDVPHAA